MMRVEILFARRAHRDTTGRVELPTSSQINAADPEKDAIEQGVAGIQTLRQEVAMKLLRAE